jgi:hypothetical protein
VGFAELLLFDEISAALPELHYFFEKINKPNKCRSDLFLSIGVGEHKKKYENSPIKLCETILKSIRVDTLKLPRRRIDGVPQSPFKVRNSKLTVVRALILSGEKQGVIQWLDSQY